MPEGKTLLSIKDLKEKPYCKFHQATSHSTNNCVCFKDLIQEVIMEGRLKFEDSKKDMKVDTDPFDAGVNFAKPILLEINMVGFTYEFHTALGDFQTNVRSVYPGVGEGLLEFLMQQKLKDRNVFLCPRCNVVFDVEVAEIFEKERIKMEFGNVPVSNQPSFSYPDVNQDYQVGSSSNNSVSMAEFRQYIDKSHHDLVNLLTHQMTTILNPILADNELKYDQLVKQVERIDRIVDYDEGQPIPQDLVVDQENLGYNEENVFNNPERERNPLSRLTRSKC
ncbi:hypothetical protein Ahy_A07g034164 isoform B [Arachis hypogaea]|uniref:Uncharacterized protein n=1 Tax=Arachis hypogaea TaxID=3818 RepID=A0A445CB59_ARAHY|nr:hypothetical protein Ahy_A07g034164 isoform B [Arachis hypogaea]